jgi:uncharacterized protein YaeQ
MPPEAMLKKKDEKDINNFIDCGNNDSNRIQLTITRDNDSI